MSDPGITTHASSSPRERRPQGGNVVTRMFSAIGLFFVQVVDEMRKVVYPTRKELGSYTLIVILFVSAVMLYTVGLDFVFNRLVAWVFGAS